MVWSCLLRDSVAAAMAMAACCKASIVASEGGSAGAAAALEEDDDDAVQLLVTALVTLLLLLLTVAVLSCWSSTPLLRSASSRWLRCLLLLLSVGMISTGLCIEEIKEDKVMMSGMSLAQRVIGYTYISTKIF